MQQGEELMRNELPETVLHCSTSPVTEPYRHPADSEQY